MNRFQADIAATRLISEPQHKAVSMPVLKRSPRPLCRAALLGLAGLMFAGLGQAAPQNSMVDRATASLAAVRGMAMGPTLGIREVCDQLEKLGYREFQEIEWDDGLYKVKATASDGGYVKLDVDGRNGEVLRVRRKS